MQCVFIRNRFGCVGANARQGRRRAFPILLGRITATQLRVPGKHRAESASVERPDEMAKAARAVCASEIGPDRACRNNQQQAARSNDR